MLSHWVVKSHTGYLTGTRERSLNPIYKARFLTHQDAQRTNAEGRIVPVFTRTIRTNHGHGFGWALARMKEGKRVRRASWENPRDSFGIDPEGEIIFGRHMNTLSVLDASHILATNWELAE